MFYRVVTAVHLAILLFGLGSWSVAADLPLPPQVCLYQGMPYISSGVGGEARALLQTQSREYTVNLTCAAKEGNSFAELPLAIVESQGRKALKAVAEGPLWYTKFPPGTYNVRAQADGKTHQQKVQGHQQQRAQLLVAWEERREGHASRKRHDGAVGIWQILSL